MRNEGRPCAQVFRALASDVRLQILDWLADPVGNFPPQSDGDPLVDGICADFIRDKLGLAASTTSRHLNLLLSAGLVHVTRRRGWTFFRRNEEVLASVFPRMNAAPVSGTGLSLDYVHVDVFANSPGEGNSLPVFVGGALLGAPTLLALTREMRHFESVYLQVRAHGDIRVRIFDLFGELPFAGHPLIGAAAVLHHRLVPTESAHQWTFLLAQRRRLGVVSERRGTDKYFATLDQGSPRIGPPLRDESLRAEVTAAFGITESMLHPTLPLQVISTGLAYLVVPVTSAGIIHSCVTSDLSDLLRRVDARFAVIFEPGKKEMRHWNNDGIIEDAATGSAAGVIGAYAVRHGLVGPVQHLILSQGRFVGRSSSLDVTTDDPADPRSSVLVGGQVAIVGQGTVSRWQ
jgi:trans-2,3-dihydro-3-hydroxyanthranilate isomerase